MGGQYSDVSKTDAGLKLTSLSLFNIACEFAQDFRIHFPKRVSLKLLYGKC